MRFKRALCAATATCVVAATTIFAGTAASAAGSLTNQELADAAAAYAAAADQAFVDADWPKVEAKADAFDDAYNELLDRLATLQGDLSEAQDALDEANAALDAARIDASAADAATSDAQQAHDDAVDDFNESVSSALGAPSWWTSIVTNPIKISDLPSQIAAAEQNLVVRQVALANAQAAYDSATGFAKVAAGLAVAVARTALAAAELRLSVLERAYDEVDGPEREQAVGDTAQALTNAQETQQHADNTVAQREQDVLDREADLAALQEQLDDLNALIDGLDAAVRSVADRRADLVDLDTVKRTVVWTLGAENDKPRAGDTIKLNFTIPNSELFALSNAKVKVLSPSGVKADCDIVDGIVAAGATVSCTANYLTSEKDAATGKVVFEVELTGYIPLGPGNPRGNAVTQTLVTATRTITVPVAAALTDGDLADTGLEAPALLAIAAALIAGGALVITRRDWIAARP